MHHTEGQARRGGSCCWPGWWCAPGVVLGLPPVRSPARLHLCFAREGVVVQTHRVAAPWTGNERGSNASVQAPSSSVPALNGASTGHCGSTSPAADPRVTGQPTLPRRGRSSDWSSVSLLCPLHCHLGCHPAEGTHVGLRSLSQKTLPPTGSTDCSMLTLQEHWSQTRAGRWQP